VKPKHFIMGITDGKNIAQMTDEIAESSMKAQIRLNEKLSIIATECTNKGCSFCFQNNLRHSGEESSD